MLGRLKTAPDQAMAIIPRVFLLMLAPLAAAAGSLLDATIVAITPGSQAFDITRVATYEGRWQQFDRASGAPLNSYAETLLPSTSDPRVLRYLTDTSDVRLVRG